jgi:OmpA-OmpF porin, OOP family
MKTNKLLVGLSLLFFGTLHAQKATQYLHFNIGGGLNELEYQVTDGIQRGKFGGTVNAAYSYFFSPSFGLQTGVGIQSFHALSTLNFLTSSNEIDIDGDSYQLRTNYTDWKEKQQVLFLDIPLLGQYKHSFNKKIGFLASAGARISIPIYSSYKVLSGEIKTTGYYNQWNIVLQDLPKHGLITTSRNYSGNLSVKPAYMAVTEAGLLYKLSPKTDFYISGYFNYGFNNILTPDTKSIYQLDGTYNSVFTSIETKKVTTISVGFKTGLYWRWAINRKTRILKSNSVLHKVDTTELTPSVKVVQPVISVQPTPDSQLVDSVILENSAIKDTVLIIAPHRDSTTVPDKIEQSTVTVKNLNDTIKTENVREKVVSLVKTTVFKFGFNSDKALNREEEQIKALSEILLENLDISLLIVGHTCNIGSREVNLIVGMRRSIAVKQMFLRNGVPATQLKTLSKAYFEPLVPNTSNSNRMKNRRVEIRILRK